MATELERAVIEAARALRREGAFARAEIDAVMEAVEALDAGQDAEIQEINWHELAEGDQLRSAKTGLFWEVTRVTALLGSSYRIGIRRGGNHGEISRPTPAEPTAFVKRGQAGKAVDMFVNVFSSGEAK